MTSAAVEDGDGRADWSVGDWYHDTRVRLTERLRPLDPADWATPVPACPGWRVHDVLGHLVGIIEDAVAGRIAGPPSPTQTSEEVGRHRDDEPQAMLDWWDGAGPLFEDALSHGDRWPAFLDVLSHEHDIRGALGERGERGGVEVERAAELLLARASLPRAVTVDLGRRSIRVLGAAADEPGLVLRTNAFEVLRLRLGRRARAQVRDLEWSSDPEPVLDDLFVFGPAEVAFAD